MHLEEIFQGVRSRSEFDPRHSGKEGSLENSSRQHDEQQYHPHPADDRRQNYTNLVSGLAQSSGFAMTAPFELLKPSQRAENAAAHTHPENVTANRITP